jgi:hypothetical protein
MYGCTNLETYEVIRTCTSVQIPGTDPFGISRFGGRPDAGVNTIAPLDVLRTVCADEQSADAVFDGQMRADEGKDRTGWTYW